MKVKNISGFYIIIAALFIGMLYINSRFFNGSSNTHIGVTYSKNYNITSEKSGIIHEVHVVPGEEVKKGKLLVRMDNRELQIEVSKLNSRIASLKKEKQEKASLLNSRIDYLRAESGIRLEELESEIRQISSELQLNKAITEEMGSGRKNVSSKKMNSPQNVRINSLRQEKELNIKATNIKIKDLTQSHKTDMLVLENEIRLLEQESEMIQSQQNQLVKYATFDGVVENVFVRDGEEVEAFKLLISIKPKHPTSVVGYLSGKKPASMEVGSKVTVRSYNNKNSSAEGQVIGFGSITELPLILQKSTAVKAFGIEVFIKIPEQNPFFTGEKVLLK